MGFEKSGDILRDACKNGYGVPAFNVFNYETIALAIDAAESLQKPILVEFYPGWCDFIDIETVAAITKSLARNVKTPIGLHLDHCGDYGIILQAMRAGYTSVMYDGSRLSFDENIANTIEVVKAAKALDIDVEAELGNIGSAANAGDFSDESKFTKPSDALTFCDRTGVSSLAIAVGNAHGNYAVLPNIDQDRIKAISSLINIPLVLHGGSGIPNAQVQDAVKNGVAKMNVATEYHNAYFNSVSSYINHGGSPDMYLCACASRSDIISFLLNKINLLNPS